MKRECFTCEKNVLYSSQHKKIKLFHLAWHMTKETSSITLKHKDNVSLIKKAFFTLMTHKKVFSLALTHGKQSFTSEKSFSLVSTHEKSFTSKRNVSPLKNVFTWRDTWFSPVKKTFLSLGSRHETFHHRRNFFTQLDIWKKCFTCEKNAIHLAQKSFFSVWTRKCLISLAPQRFCTHCTTW